MTLDSLNAFTVTVVLQSVLWKYKNIFKDNTVYIGQFSKFEMKLKKKFLTENWNNFLGGRAFFQGRSGKGKQIKKNISA